MSDIQSARAFFGFGPDEAIDLITLRSRRFNKDRAARTDEEKQQIARYFQLLAGAPSAPPQPPAPPPKPKPPAAKADRAADAAARREQAEEAWPAVRSAVRSLLEDDVINNTFGLMNRLRAALNNFSRLTAGGADFLGESLRAEIADTLLRLTSESIRESLHKGEVPITNGVIRTKNSILRALGVEIPESHQEIDVSKYPHRNW